MESETFQSNRSTCEVFCENQFEQKKEKEICAGDIIKLACNEQVPVNLVLLSSSQPDGSCGLDTSTING